MVEEIQNSKKVHPHAARRVQSESTILDSRAMETNFVRSRLETFQASVLRDVEHRISGMIDEVMQEIRQNELRQNEFGNFAAQQRTMRQHHQNAHTWNNRVNETSASNAADNLRNRSKSKTSQMSQKSQAINRNSKESTSNNNNNNNTVEHKTNSKVEGQRRALPEKIFITRESYLTALLEVDHMRTIYHIFYIILLWFLMNSICYDYFVEGRVNFGLTTFKLGLAGLHYVAGVWLLEHIFVFCLYYTFKIWVTIRMKLNRQPFLQSFWSNSCLILYICSQLIFGYIAAVLCLKWNLPFVTASVLLLESTRLLMKMHAFVRTNTSRVLSSNGKLKADADVAIIKPTARYTVPPFRCYLYFLFAPTLIYRDSYPRTTQIRWKFAFSRITEVVAIAFLYSYIHERHIKVHYANYGLEKLTTTSLLVKIFGMIMPSIIIFLCGFYMILHSWLNFTSELLRFGDRMFYKDWWTVSTFDAYYRNWNVVVHDWLYEYIYKDFYEHIFKGSKVAASMMVFLVSALVHELILDFALQLFFPVMFVFFGFVGVALVYLTKKAPKNIGNIFLWFSLIFGNGMMISFYAMEYYARVNCPRTYNSWLDYMTPSVWSCYN